MKRQAKKKPVKKKRSIKAWAIVDKKTGKLFTSRFVECQHYDVATNKEEALKYRGESYAKVVPCEIKLLLKNT